jgi:methylated-DNA-[protein]-cysteine S-methyltransferase
LQTVTRTHTTRTHTTRTHTTLASPVGELTLVAEGGALVGLYFPGHWYLPDPGTFGSRTEDGWDDAATQLGEYFAGRRQVFQLPLDPQGDDRRRRVWDLIARVPYGETVTYGHLAQELGDGTTPRTVGGAVGRNPLSILIPCHRIVGSTGRLTGYAGGLERKAWLFDLEGGSSGRSTRLF